MTDSITDKSLKDIQIKPGRIPFKFASGQKQGPLESFEFMTFLYTPKMRKPYKHLIQTKPSKGN